MHWLAIVHGVIHATVLGVIAFFILFAAGKAESFTALLGKLLGYWVLLLAVGGLACGIYLGVTGKGPMMGPPGHPGPWMHHWHDGPMMQPPPPPPAGTPAPAPNKT